MKTRVLALSFACVLGFAPFAIAQSTMSPSTAAVPATPTTPIATPEAPSALAASKVAHTTLPTSDKFTTLSAATSHCPGDTVVWSSKTGHSFHLATSKMFGKTKHGAYVCEKDALASGLHASKM